jgi:hypothetical protein
MLTLLFWTSFIGATDLNRLSKACDNVDKKYNARTCIHRLIETIAEESYAENVEAQELVNEQLFKSLVNDPESLLNELGKIKEKETLRLVLMEFKSPVSDLINLDDAKMALAKIKGNERIKTEIIRNIKIAEPKGGWLSIEIDWGFSGKRIKGIQGEKQDSIDVGNYEYQPYLLSGFNRTTDIIIEIFDGSNIMEESVLLAALKSNCYKIKKENGKIISKIISCIWD